LLLVNVNNQWVIFVFQISNLSAVCKCLNNDLKEVSTCFNQFIFITVFIMVVVAVAAVSDSLPSNL
jgi:hypothetical protein